MSQSTIVSDFTETAQSIIPIAFRIPAPGKRDPYFGIPRSSYFSMEKEGLLKLIRIRKRGNLRGITLIPFDAMLALVNSQKEGA